MDLVTRSRYTIIRMIPVKRVAPQRCFGLKGNIFGSKQYFPIGPIRESCVDQETFVGTWIQDQYNVKKSKKTWVNRLRPEELERESMNVYEVGMSVNTMVKNGCSKWNSGMSSETLDFQRL